MRHNYIISLYFIYIFPPLFSIGGWDTKVRKTRVGYLFTCKYLFYVITSVCIVFSRYWSSKLCNNYGSLYCRSGASKNSLHMKLEAGTLKNTNTLFWPTNIRLIIDKCDLWHMYKCFKKNANKNRCITVWIMLPIQLKLFKLNFYMNIIFYTLWNVLLFQIHIVNV